jgi:hypothetical protein
MNSRNNTEEWLIKELEQAKLALNLWWKNAVKENSYPKKLENRILFLRGYIKAVRLLKNEKEVTRIAKEAQQQYANLGIFRSKGHV